MRIDHKKRIGSSGQPHSTRLATSHYLDRGLALLPLARPNPREGIKGKEPATRNGFKNATRDKAAFKQLVKAMPRYNLGIATGATGGLLVLDLDTRHGGDETFRQLESKLGPLPHDTPCVKTGGGGRHFYVRHEPGIPFTRTKLGAGVDVLGDGSYAVVPPSLHASGQRYEWQRGLPADLSDLPRLPKSWRKELRQALAQAPAAGKGRSSRRAIPEGTRNDTLTKFAGRLLRQGKVVDEVRSRLMQMNSERCRPPLEVEEVEAIVASVSQYDNGRSAGDPSSPEAMAHGFLEQFYKRGRHLRLEHDNRFWRYKDHYWQPMRDTVLEGEILRYVTRKGAVTNKPKTSVVAEIIKFLRLLQVVDDDDLHFRSDPPEALNLANGELWLTRDGLPQLRKHKASSGFRSRLAVEYDPKATCPEFDKALAEIFSKAENPAELVGLWHEVMGYVIQPRRHIPMILVLYGSGGNGKTQLIKTLVQLLGSEAAYSGSVGDLVRNRFAYAALVGKQIFVDDDVQQGIRLPDGILKKISEEKALTADVKHHAMLNFKVRVVPVLLCNNVPSLGDVSEGMRRRLLVIEFKKRFRGKSEDKDLFERIWRNEMPGVLNRALEGLQRVMRRNRLSYPDDCKAALDTFLGRANPLKAFVEDVCTPKIQGKVPLQRLFVEYLEWAKQSGITKTLQRQNFKSHLNHLGYGSKKTNVGQAILGLELR